MLIEQEYELTNVDQLTPHPENSRRGDVDLIQESIQSNGWFGALVAQRSTGHVLVGNHRLAAAIAEGAKQVPVLWVDVDDERAVRILLGDNRISDLATDDPRALAALLEQLAETGYAGTGYATDVVAEILAAAADHPALTDVDDAPELTDDPITREGDVWELGHHRLVCGSATHVDDVLAALNGSPAAMLFTDPPYGVAYVGGTGLTIQNDDLDEKRLRQLLDESFASAAAVLSPGGAFYVCSPSGYLETTFRLALAGAGLQLRQQLVWVKDRFVLGRADYHGQHETMLYGWADGDPHFEPAHDTMLYGWASGAAHTWDGGRKQSTVWEFPRPAKSVLHPTMKPVDLVRLAIENNTRPGAVVLDHFAGSGSTLIACHHAGRLAALVELDPKYVDVICRRWEEHTGITPIRDGVPVTFLDAA